MVVDAEVRDDGGQAFPRAHNVSAGMTLRDYFAAAALQGVLASNRDTCWQHEKVAEFCYAQADAMLEARKR